MNSVFTREWRPPVGAPDRQHGIYLLHGFGEHSGRYNRLGHWLSRQGWHVAAHDHQGHGQSSGMPGVMKPLGAFATQAAIQIQSFAQQTAKPPVLLGHSLGGALAAELVLLHALPVSALVLSAPAFKPFMGRRDLFQLRLLHQLAPTFRLKRAFDPAVLTHDATEAQAAAADPLQNRYVSASLIQWLVDAGRLALEHAAQLKVDTLLLVPGADKVVDAAGALAFANAAPDGLVTVNHYADSYHEVFNETPDQREQAMADVQQWLLQKHL